MLLHPRLVMNSSRAGNLWDKLVVRHTWLVPRAPEEPSDAERRAHEASHVPYRSWWASCVVGRGRPTPQPHRRALHAGLPTLQSDYFFPLGDAEIKAISIVQVQSGMEGSSLIR